MKVKKLVYISLGAYSLLGVRNKLESIAKSFGEQFEEFHLLFFCNDIDEPFKEGNIHYIPFKVEAKIPWIFTKYYLWRFQEYFLRKAKFKYISDKLKEFKGTDLIIFRYVSSDLAFYNWLKSLRTPVVFEHNTLEIEEIKRIPNQTLRVYYEKGERYFGPKVRAIAKALISVSVPVDDYQKEQVKGKTPSYVVGNAVEVDKFKSKTDRLKSEKDSLRLIITSGYPNPWHGVDHLLDLIENSSRLELNLVGNFENEEIARAKTMGNKVRIYGALSGDDYDKVFNESDIAVSSLALYRLNLEKGASVLKTKEYLARSIPFIIGYKDKDLEDVKALEDFYLKVDLKNDLKNWTEESIIEFYESLKSKKLSEMRELAKANFSFEKKAQIYQEVFVEI